MALGMLMGVMNMFMITMMLMSRTVEKMHMILNHSNSLMMRTVVATVPYGTVTQLLRFLEYHMKQVWSVPLKTLAYGILCMHRCHWSFSIFFNIEYVSMLCICIQSVTNSCFTMSPFNSIQSYLRVV